jgi:hypothetical protein
MFTKKYIVVIHPLGTFDEMAFFNAIQGFQVWGRITENTYIVNSKLAPLEIHNLLSKYAINCRIFISRITSPAAWSNTICSNEWIQNNL